MEQEQKKNQIPLWAIILIIMAGVVIVGMIVSGGGNKNTYVPSSSGYQSSSSSSSSIINTKKTYGLGDKFEFDDLEITLGTTYSFDVINNRFSENNGATVVKLPVTVKNIGTETNSLNMFFYSIFGSKGTEIDSMAAYFDDSVDYAGDLRTGAQYTKYFYFLYDGNGKYVMEFDNFSEEIEVEFNISR